MRVFVKDPVYGKIIYDENFWTGNKVITINGVQTDKFSKKVYTIQGKMFIIKGNYITGISLYIDGKNITISRKTAWYEMLLAMLPFLFLMIWGNSSALCKIFPVVGGALGGALGGIAIVISLIFIKKQKSLLYKILIGIAVFAVTIFIAFITALALLQIMA